MSYALLKRNKKKKTPTSEGNFISIMNIFL